MHSHRGKGHRRTKKEAVCELRREATEETNPASGVMNSLDFGLQLPKL